MGPLIHIAMRPSVFTKTSDSTFGKLLNSYREFGQGKTFVEEKLYSFNLLKLLPVESPGFKALMDTGLNLSAQKIVSLSKIAGFVTGVDRGLQTLNRIGYATDYFISATPKKLAEYPVFKDHERGQLGWAMLFTQKNYLSLKPIAKKLDGLINEHNKNPTPEKLSEILRLHSNYKNAAGED
jgi:hypothetical protein